jgi:hypothetical protein
MLPLKELRCALTGSRFLFSCLASLHVAFDTGVEAGQLQSCLLSLLQLPVTQQTPSPLSDVS